MSANVEEMSRARTGRWVWVLGYCVCILCMHGDFSLPSAAQSNALSLLVISLQWSQYSTDYIKRLKKFSHTQDKGKTVFNHYEPTFSPLSFVSVIQTGTGLRLFGLAKLKQLYVYTLMMNYSFTNTGQNEAKEKCTIWYFFAQRLMFLSPSMT